MRFAHSEGKGCAALSGRMRGIRPCITCLRGTRPVIVASSPWDPPHGQGGETTAPGQTTAARIAIHLTYVRFNRQILRAKPLRPVEGCENCIS